MKKILINGAPRSGTSWLGQIFNSNLNTAFRFQPLFSYELKDFLNERSSEEDIDLFMNKCLNAQSDFVLQKNQKSRKVHPCFSKNKNITHLVLKHVRYHNLLTNLLEKKEDIKFVFIVRNPCGAINSWIKTPREFDPSWDISEFLRGDLKNKGKKEEFNGYLKWKESASIFLKLNLKFPDRTIVTQYEDLCENRVAETKRLFDFCELNMDEQTLNFLNISKEKDINDPDTVFRNKNNYKKWKKELDLSIIDYIYKDLKETKLEIFLDR
jgi:hypothetical protein